jgi:hypothetical protein
VIGDWRLVRQVAQLVGLFLISAVFSGCGSISDSTATIFIDPAKYQFSSCEQLARHRKQLVSREQELRMLMERAEQGVGGAVVNVVAYKGDYVATTEESACSTEPLARKIVRRRPAGQAIPP